jgi:hypothetical protein
MNEYIRTNDEGASVLDYGLLNVADRINFLEDCRRIAANILLDLEDEDFSNAEKAESINSAASVALDHLYLVDGNGDDVEVDPDTLNMMRDTIESALAEHYGIELA